jgi:DedD protein
MLGVSMSGGPVSLHTLLPIPGVPARVPVAPTAGNTAKQTPKANPIKSHRLTSGRPSNTAPVLVSAKNSTSTKATPKPSATATHSATPTATVRPPTTPPPSPSTKPPVPSTSATKTP